jgi:hypothetical protein
MKAGRQLATSWQHEVLERPQLGHDGIHHRLEAGDPFRTNGVRRLATFLGSQLGAQDEQIALN